jgi:FkbM family methyltransferase
MKWNFSQGLEDLIVADYFKDKRGTFADFGSNDGVTFSNTYALSLRGWRGLCVEPSAEAYRRLEFNYRGNDKVKLYNCAATASYAGLIDFYESGSHISDADTSLLSTVNENELKRWVGSNNVFSKIRATACPIKLILEDAGFETIDFFSLDVEGSELELLPHIDFGKYKTQLVCIEYNSKPEILKEITDYCSQFGLTKELLKNAENIILSI